MRRSASCGGFGALALSEGMVVLSPRGRAPVLANQQTQQKMAAPSKPQRGDYLVAECRKVFWTEALNTTPTLVIFAVTLAFFSAASAFLERYVVTATENIVVFFVGSYVVFSSYFVFHYFLGRYSSSYQHIEKDKQFYVLSNLIKSATLLSYTPLAAQVLYQTMVLDVWSTNRIRNLGCMYAIPDFVSLFMVSRMSWTTILHHLAVCVFNAASLYNDYQQNNVCRLMVVYAIFSTFAYLVNLLLAIRFLGISSFMRSIMSGLALLIYSSCCGVNWTWQVYYIPKLISAGHTWSVYSYVALIVLVVWDDIVLMKWLYAKAIGVLGKGEDAVRTGGKQGQLGKKGA